MKRKLLLIAVTLLCSVGMWADEIVIDITSGRLKNADLASTTGWSITKSGGGNNYGHLTDGVVPLVEFYHTWSQDNAGGTIGTTQNFSITQNVTLSPGTYRLKAYGFYREGNGNGMNTKASLKAGSNTIYLHGLDSGELDSYSGANDAKKAANAFNAGAMLNTLEFEMASEQTIQVGVTGYIDTYCSWCVVGSMTIVRVENGTEVTNKITNPSFETGNTTGWTYDTNGSRGDATDHGAKSTADNTYKMSPSDGSYLFNIHPWGYAIKQTISDIPNGKYTVTAVVASNSDQTNPSKVYLLANDTHNGIWCDKSEKIGVVGWVSAVVTDGSLTIGAVGSNNDEERSYLDEGLWWYKVDNFRLIYSGNDISYYSPASFTSGNEATKNTWYAFTVTTAGYYKITAEAAATIRYTQDDSDDADTGGETITLAAGGYTVMNLPEGKFYFKSNATGDITFEALSSTNATNVTDLFITNPSFEDADMSSWNLDGVFSRQNGSDLSGKSGDYYAGSSYTNQTKSISQSLTGLPAGNYILKVRAKVAQFNSSSSLNNANVTMGGNSTPVRYEYEDDYVVAYNAASDNASPSISFGGKVDNYGYFYCDNFILTYYNTLPNISISDLTACAMDADIRTALTSASTTYNGSKTAANYNALQTAIINAKNSIAKYGTSENSDWTGLITNPSFEQGGTVSTAPGWILRGGNSTSTNGNDSMSEKNGDHYLSYWTNSTTGSEVYQTISNLPAGNYKLSADVNTEVNTTLTLKAGSVKNAIVATSTSSIPMEVYFTLAEMSSLEIGVGTLTDRGNGGVWYAMDHFQLTFNPTLPESGTLTAVSGAMNSDVNNAQTTAISTYDAFNGQTMDNLLEVQSAKYGAIQSFVVYEKIATIRSTYSSKVEGLDSDGQSAYSTAINTASTGAETMYDACSYATAAAAETAYNRDYVTAVKAQTTAGSDMTDAIKNPSFDTKDANGWTITETSHGNQQYGSLTAESWNNNNVTYSQELLDLHPGIYRLTAQVDNGKDNSNVTLFASYGENTPISTLATYRAISSYASTSSDLISDKSLCLTTVLINIEGEENQTLTIGVKDVSTGNGWMIFDNFHLTYVGASLPASMEKVTGLMYAGAKDDSDDAVDAYESAYATYNSDKTQSNYDAAFSAFEAAQAAIALAEASKATYASVSSSDIAAYKSRMGELLATTNVYTAEAYEKWYANVETNYSAGLYTDEEVVTLTAAGACQGAAETAHQKANRIDEVLLSTWTFGGEQCSDYSKSLYINTWSVEGNTDGSNFQTPFFEYWTSDANSLGEATMASTMTDLDANREYSLDIWARVRQTNGQTKGEDKITIRLSNGSAVDLAAGTQVGSSQFYLKHFRAYGKTDASGNLTITITVANDSKVSWLSFKDMMLKPKADVIVSAKAGKYGTVILPFAYNFAEDDDFSNIKFYSCASVNNGYTQIEEVSTPAANTPYIIKNNGGSDFSKTISGFNVAEENSYTVGLLTGVYTDAYIPMSDASNSYYVLQTKDDVQAFYKVEDDDFPGTPYKCYLKIPAATPVKAFLFPENPTDINAIEAAENEKTEIYNLAGQRLSKAQKGVNIINGKKVLVK